MECDVLRECTQEQEMRVCPVILKMVETEEILTRCSRRDGKAGLWLLLGVVHYNMKNYKACSITEMTDGFRNIRWQCKKEVEKIF
jgi:hypothetical protein